MYRWCHIQQLLFIHIPRLAALFLFLTTPRLICQEITKGGIDSPTNAIRFCKDLQQAVKAGRKDQVASWVNGFPIQVESAVRVRATAGTLKAPNSILLIDKADFIQHFAVIFNDGLRQSLFGNSACELEYNSDGTARIASGKIEIDQSEDGKKTVITAISPPQNYEKFYSDQATYEIGAKNFLVDLRRALSAGDRDAVATLCRYPLSVNSAGKTKMLNDRGELLARFEEVFTARIRRAVIESAEPTQTGWRGFMIGDGEVWFDSVVGTDVMRIGTINIS